MGTKITRLAAVILLLLATTYATCRKNCTETRYSFEAGIKVYPDADTLNINDTIWIEFSNPTLLKDMNTGNQIEYSGAANLGTSLTFLKFTGGSVNDPGVIGSVSSFEYAVVEGSFIPDNLLPEQNRDFKFKEADGKYKFKIAVIPKLSGVFAIGIDNAANVFRRNDKCTKASFAFKLQDTDNHIYFLEQNRPGYTPSGLELTNLYCFKVK